MGIVGYRQLTVEEVALINEVKAAGDKLDELCQRLQNQPGTDGRWLAIGRTNLQQGLMALTRSVARPTNF